MDTLRPVSRKSLPLTAKDVADLDALRGSEVHRAALRYRAGVEVSVDDSDASLLHSVLVAGLRAVSEEVDAAGYAEMAAERDTSRRQALARRRKPSWADEQ